MPRLMLLCIALLLPTQTPICTVELPHRILTKQCHQLPSIKAIHPIALHRLPLLNSAIHHHLLLLPLPWLHQANTKHISPHRITIISGQLHQLRHQQTTSRGSLHQFRRMMHLLLRLQHRHLTVYFINRAGLLLLALPTRLIQTMAIPHLEATQGTASLLE